MKETVRNMFRSLGVERKPSGRELEASEWDQQYQSGRWDYLGGLDELAHYSVIAGYCQYFASKGRYLDVGCGHGVLQQRLAYLPYGSYLGIDISPEAIRKAGDLMNDRTRFEAVPALEFNSTQKFDVIIFNESLYCFDDAIPVMKHFSQFLSGDGVFVVSMHLNETSLYHWKKLGESFIFLDEVEITSRDATSWRLKVLQPAGNTPAE